MTYCASFNRFSRFGCTLIKERKKLKPRTLICWVCVSPSGKIFLKPNFARLFRLDDVINRAKYFFNRFTRMSLARGQTYHHFQCKPWVAITTVVLPYNCDPHNPHHHSHPHYLKVHFLSRLIKSMHGCSTTAFGRQPNLQQHHHFEISCLVIVMLPFQENPI